MTRLVVGVDGPLARGLGASAPPDRLGVVAEAILAQRPSELVIVAVGPPVGPLGAAPTDALAAAVDATLSVAVVAVKLATQLEQPVRIALVAPASAVLPDHLDGVRSVAAAGLAMLTEVAAALEGIRINTIAVADDVPADEVARVVDLVLDERIAHLNGATVRLDDGRDAVLTAQTRSEE